MSAKFVRDVIGEPESWPNHLNGHSKEPPDMRGAVITDAFALGDQIGVQTRGAACGETFSTFVVENQILRDRLTQVLRANKNVYAAVATAL
jgi:hypothetical protein